MKGKLITLEGINGIGKTYYFNYLKSVFNDIYFNGEINDQGHQGINKSIFEILLSTNDRFFDTGNAKMETLLIMAKQANDEERVIIPRLNNGENVISDRGFDTVCAVQSIMMYRKYGGNIMDHFNNVYMTLRTFNLLPDKTILLTGDIDSSIRRATLRDGYPYSDSELDILKKESSIFRMLSEIDKDRFVVIDVDRDTESIKNDLVMTLKRVIK